MTVSADMRWWPRASASALFACPPFPGSRAAALAEPVPASDASPARQDVECCIDAMRRHRVGGTFWAARPMLPTGTTVLARPADPAQYRAMLDEARARSTKIVFWLPDDRALDVVRAPVSAITGPCDPWHAIAQAGELWAAPDDELAVIAAVAGVPRRLFGEQISAPGPSRDAADLLGDLLAGARFRDPFSGAALAPAAALELLGFWRAMIDANRPIGAIYGVAFWKRASVAPLLWDGGTADRFRATVGPDDTTADAPAAAAWIARTPAAGLAHLERSGVLIHQIEDGFIRSVGLGADCVPPLSIVVDPYGAHYDPAQPSALETLLEDAVFTPDMLDRARRLRDVIVARGISKYGLATQPAARPAGVRRHVLVTGQVEDDQSVLKGGGGLTNLDLLRRVRAIESDAFITYRPHPDVDAGHRTGGIADEIVLGIADAVGRGGDITALIDSADHVHVLTSLAGFEALLRGRPVTTHGVPFYAGWGLTDDRGPVPPRRTARRSLDELVAATLLLYPRYLDPLSGLPCPPEVMIDRLLAGHRRQNTPLVFARRMIGGVSAAVRRMATGRVR